jgi:hypothetical protein
MKNGLGNLALCDAGQLAAAVRNRLKRIEHRAALIDGFLAQTGLASNPNPVDISPGPSISYKRIPACSQVAPRRRWEPFRSLRRLPRP